MTANIWFQDGLWNIHYGGHTYTRKTQQAMMELVKLLTDAMVKK